MPGTTDKRLLRGERTRQAVLRRAVDVASLEGLSGLSFGRLAEDTGMSKAGVQTLFRTKEALQLATVDTFRDVFVDAVVRPAETAPAGRKRLRALLDHWIVYARTPLLPGGCFRVATLAEFDGRPGPVRDALLRDQRTWIGRLAGELGAAGRPAPQDAAFGLDALLCATNSALQSGDAEAVPRLNRLVAPLLAG